MNQIAIRGIAPNNLNDDRTLLLLDVTFNGEVFAWETRISPLYTGSFNNYIEENTDKIFSDIENKLELWETLSPKTREIVVEGDEIITVAIERSEIVRPTYPDYYVLRKQEYPSIQEQLDAFWKDGSVQQSMQQTIQNIKNKYPKQ